MHQVKRPSVERSAARQGSAPQEGPTLTPPRDPVAFEAARPSRDTLEATSVRPTPPAGGDGAYASQHRGELAAYNDYWRGMDSSMLQKVGITTAHFPSAGLVLDMGSGSGKGTHDLAAVCPALTVRGVDINPVAVEESRNRHKLPNLSYERGDATQLVAPEGSVAAILNSSTMHHVTSFNEPPYGLDGLSRSLDAQAKMLAPGGVLIIRDFVIPRGPERVLLELPTSDGVDPSAASGDTAVQKLSSAAAFERFARQFRSSQNPTSPVAYERRDGAEPGWQRYEVSHRAAAEFLLHKDYRDHWDVELREEYTYFTQARFESELAARGLRVVHSAELHNPWIVANRFEGKAKLFDLTGAALPFPPTNYFIVGEKVAPDAPVRLFHSLDQVVGEPTFLRTRSFENAATGQVFDLADRPGTTLDLLPWFERDGNLFVVARHGFPRPLVNLSADSPNLDGNRQAGYIPEPVAAIVDEHEDPTAAAQRVLAERAGISNQSVRAVHGTMTYYPSPGGLAERVVARFVELEPDAKPTGKVDNLTGFASTGSVGPMEATQLLRAGQVGGLFDMRLELNTYELLLERRRSVGPWIGAAIAPREQGEGLDERLVPAKRALTGKRRRAFAEIERAPKSSFLEVRVGTFQELDGKDQPLGEAQREYVVPRTLSTNTVSALPLVRSGGRIYIGLEDRDLPAPQLFTGSSRHTTCPAWRLPKNVESLGEANRWVRERLAHDLGAEALATWPLGASYLPSPGVTPEKVYPLAVEVSLASAARSKLTWVALDELVDKRHLIQSAHLRIGALRLAHATGLLG